MTVPFSEADAAPATTVAVLVELDELLEDPELPDELELLDERDLPREELSPDDPWRFMEPEGFVLLVVREPLPEFDWLLLEELELEPSDALSELPAVAAPLLDLPVEVAWPLEVLFAPFELASVSAVDAPVDVLAALPPWVPPPDVYASWAATALAKSVL